MNVGSHTDTRPHTDPHPNTDTTPPPHTHTRTRTHAQHDCPLGTKLIPKVTEVSPAPNTQTQIAARECLGAKAYIHSTTDLWKPHSTWYTKNMCAVRPSEWRLWLGSWCIGAVSSRTSGIFFFHLLTTGLRLSSHWPAGRPSVNEYTRWTLI